MKALLRIALLIFKYSVLLLLCWLARCLYTLPTLENAFLQIGQGYLGEKFLVQCTVQLSYPSHVYLVSPLILLLSSSSMFSLLLSDVVGLPGLFSSPFMSPLVKVMVIRRVVVIKRLVVIRKVVVIGKVVVTGRVVVIRWVENV